MSYRKFGKNDVLINTMKTHPRSEFFIHSGTIFYNNLTYHPSAFRPYPNNVYMTDPGYANLYEYNINRVSGTNDLIYPYIIKDGSRAMFWVTGSAMSMDDYEGLEFGDLMTASYPQYASIKRTFDYTPSGSCNLRLKEDCAHFMDYWSLKNVLNHYGTVSPHFLVSSSYNGGWNKDNQNLNLIHIPSIFYGSKIRPGTVSLKYYMTGSMIGELRDTRENGVLYQVSGSTYDSSNGTYSDDHIGKVAGVVLYNEGFIVLTGSWALDERRQAYRGPGSGLYYPGWRWWGFGARDGVPWNMEYSSSPISSSFSLYFEGINKTEVMTLHARAPRGKVNYSNNPTFLKYDQTKTTFTSSHIYEENKNQLIKNTVSSSFSNYEASFKRQVYINKIAVYDDKQQLIGIATLADPVLKEEDQELSFKMKLDL